jgi:hypothetical protein
MQEEGYWDKFLEGRRWKRKMWEEWLQENPSWTDSWEEPNEWLPGEKERIEGKDSVWEAVRRSSEEHRAEKEPLWEKNKEFWLRAREEIRIEKEEKHKAK